MQNQEIERICPESRNGWRQWLAENSIDKQAVWLVYHKKKSESTTITWNDAVEEALCFGWIDGVRKTIDADTFMQYFCKRKAKSTWSKINKLKVQSLIEQGIFTPAGHKSVEIAKSNGSWSILDDVEELIIPLDLEQEFKSKPGSKEFFLSLSKSKKKEILQSLVLARRPETRQARIIKIVEQASGL